MTNNDPYPYDNVFNGIQKLFKAERLQNGIIYISHGAQFSRAGVVGAWFIMLSLLTISIVMAVHNQFVITVLTLIPVVLILAYVMDYQGVEFDTNNKQVRNYRSYLGYKMGDWYDLEKFNQLTINQETVSEYIHDVGNRNYVTHHFYFLYLVNNENNLSIKLYEDRSITKMKLIAIKFSEISGLTFFDKNS